MAIFLTTPANILHHRCKSCISTCKTKSLVKDLINLFAWLIWIFHHANAVRVTVEGKNVNSEKKSVQS